MRIAHLKIALFTLLLVAPVASLLLFGSVERYGRDHTQFPEIAKLLRGKKGQFDQFGDAVLGRAAARKLAVMARNWVGYRLVGFVDTRQVVSGKRDWLFLRQEFDNGRCLDPDWAAVQLRSLDALIAMARASGIDMHISLSPDKSTIYPEMLSGFARGYWKCRVENIATLRHLIKREVPALIDHAEPLLAEKGRRPDVPLYFTTDTHWTAYGGALALRQLAAAIDPHLRLPSPLLSGAVTMRSADLGKMLLQPVQEAAAAIDPLPDEVQRALSRDATGRRTVIAHDSFYGSIAPQLRELFPGAEFLHAIRADPDTLRSAVASADRLILNMIERLLLEQTDRGALNWDAPLAGAIYARNSERARECASFQAAGSLTSGDAIAIPAVAAHNVPCIRLSMVTAEGSVLEIDLPNAETGAFEPGRTMKYRVPAGSLAIGFVLPAYVAGSRIQLRVGGGDRPASISAIEVGAIARPLSLQP